MSTIVIDVMPKRELLDPAGKAVARAIEADGVEGFVDVRIGKRFELHTDGEVSATQLERATALARDLLSNGVIEDVVDIRVEP